MHMTPSLCNSTNVPAKVQVWLAQAGVTYAYLLKDPKSDGTDGGTDGPGLAIGLSFMAAVLVLAVIAVAFFVRRRRLRQAADAAAAKEAAMRNGQVDAFEMLNSFPPKDRQLMQDWNQQAFAPPLTVGMTSYNSHHDPNAIMQCGVPDPLIPGAYLPVRLQ